MEQTVYEETDPLADSYLKKRFNCSLCGSKFSKEEYLANHFSVCKYIQNPADADVIESEDSKEAVQTQEDLDNYTIKCESSELKLGIKQEIEDIDVTETTISESASTDSGQSTQHTKAETSDKLFNRTTTDNQATQSPQLEENTKEDLHEAKKKEKRKYVWRRQIPKTLFKCPTCDYTTARRCHIIQHTHTHTGQKPHKCNICPYASSNMNGLVTHLRTHSGEKPFKCNLCDYASTAKPSLIMHMRTHTGERRYKCELCEYSSVQPGGLIVHMSKHTGNKPFKCESCDYASAHHGNLTQHMKSHTEVKSFKCDICEYACRNGATLEMHTRIHTGQKPFKCQICDYASAQRGQLTLHIRKHTGEKPFKCERCGYASANVSNLKKHLKTHAKEEPLT